MTYVNRVVIQGKLTKDGETRSTPSGKAVTKFLVLTEKKVNEQFVGELHTVIVWGVRGQEGAAMFQKGDWVRVEGELSAREYIDRKTNEVKRVRDVIAPELKAIDAKKPDLRARAAGDTDNVDF